MNIAKIGTLILLLVVIALLIIVPLFTGATFFGQYAFLNDLMTPAEFLQHEQEITKRLEIIVTFLGKSFFK